MRASRTSSGARRAGRPTTLSPSPRSRWALAPEIVDRRGSYVGGLLLAGEELRTEPLHVTIVGRLDDPSAKVMFSAARRAPTAYRLVEWWDPKAAPPPRGEAIFPQLDHSAAYLCANGACSTPMATADALTRRIGRAIAQAGGE